MRGYHVYRDLDCSGGGNTDLQQGNMYVSELEDPFAVAVLKNGKVVRHVLLIAYLLCISQSLSW